MLLTLQTEKKTNLHHYHFHNMKHEMFEAKVFWNRLLAPDPANYTKLYLNCRQHFTGHILPYRHPRLASVTVIKYLLYLMCIESQYTAIIKEKIYFIGNCCISQSR